MLKILKAMFTSKSKKRIAELEQENRILAHERDVMLLAVGIAATKTNESLSQMLFDARVMYVEMNKEE